MAKSIDDSSVPVDSSGLSLRLLSLLVVVPALVVAFLIHIYGCNIAYWDGWEEYDLFHSMLQHSLTLDDLFAQHNEHRILLPRLFLIAATNFGPYTDTAELWISWALACLSSLCLWRLARYTGCSGVTGVLLLAGANLMLFNLLAFEDWLWGFQIGFLLPVLWITAAVWCVSVSRGWMQFFWAALWSVFDTFTVASGFVCWIVLVPLLLFPGGEFRFRWRGMLVHLVGFGATLALYLNGYTTPGGHPATDTVVRDPAGALNYFLTYVGAPLADQAPPYTPVVMWANFGAGILLVGIYLACVVLLVCFWRHPLVWKRALPWLTLSHYGFCAALITTVGRMGFGIDQALASRYVVFSSLIPMGLIFAGGYLFPAALPYLKWPRVRQVYTGAIVGVPLFCLGLYLWTASQALAHWQEISDRNYLQKAALVFINQPSAEPILNMTAYPSIDLLKRFVKNRAEQGYVEKVLTDSDISPLADPSPPDPAYGLLAAPAPGAAGYTLTGWAYLPKAKRHADLVIITLPDAQKRDSIVGMGGRAGYDDITGAKEHLLEEEPTKFSIVLPAGTNLAGLKAWSFDGQEERAYEIPQESNAAAH